MINVNMSVKNVVRAQKIIIEILAHVFVSISDTSVIVCDGIINATDSVSTNVTNAIPANMTNTMSTNVTSTVAITSDDKKVKYKIDCYILYKVLLVIILLIIMPIICYPYVKHGSKQKNVLFC